MEYHSKVKCIGPVTFPEFTAEYAFMVPFYMWSGLPRDLERWQPTVDDMLRGLDRTIHQRMYLYIEQRKVQKGEKGYDKGLHIDGNYVEPLNTFEQRLAGAGQFMYAGTIRDEVVVMASNMVCNRACVGRFDGVCNANGGVAHMDVEKGFWVPFDPFTAYAMTAATIHESTACRFAGDRTVVRITIPNLDLDTWRVFKL